MSGDKDDLKSIKVYKFNNTKENWHEFALKFRVIADNKGYEDIIDGTVTLPPLTKKNTLKYSQRWNLKTREDKVEVYTKFLN